MVKTSSGNTYALQVGLYGSFIIVDLLHKYNKVSYVAGAISFSGTTRNTVRINPPRENRLDRDVENTLHHSVANSHHNTQIDSERVPLEDRMPQHTVIGMGYPVHAKPEIYSVTVKNENSENKKLG